MLCAIKVVPCKHKGVSLFLACSPNRIDYIAGMIRNVQPEAIDKINKKIDELIAEFGGTVSHRTSQAFKAKFKEFLKKEQIRGEWWLADLLKKRGL